MIVSLPLAILFAVAAMFSLFEFLQRRGAREVASYLADREAQATHAIMNGGMAVMFWRSFGATATTGLKALFAATVVVLAARLVLGWNRRPPGRAAGTGYHLIGVAAMLWATYRMDAAMSAMPSMAGMAHMPPMPGGPAWPAWLLLVLFAADGLATGLLAGFAPRTMLRMAEIAAGDPDRGIPPPADQVRAVRLAAIPHCLMDAGMAAMLWPLT